MSKLITRNSLNVREDCNNVNVISDNESRLDQNKKNTIEEISKNNKRSSDIGGRRRVDGIK